MYTTSVQQHVTASRAAVYAALVDPERVVRWRVPDGMRGEVEWLDREDGRFRVTLTYDGEGTGKTAGRSDSYLARFVTIEPEHLVVETMSFEADDPGLVEPMTMTTTVVDAPDGSGCVVTMVHEGVPDAVPRQDNELGMRMALKNLARYVEGG